MQDKKLKIILGLIGSTPIIFYAFIVLFIVLLFPLMLIAGNAVETAPTQSAHDFTGWYTELPTNTGYGIPVELNSQNRIYLDSGFGMRLHPIHKVWKMHTGIDIDQELNDLILAAEDGTVTLAESNGGYGNLVIIKHDFNYKTYYAHLNSFNVRVGQKVKRGDVIGYAGTTGTSTGVHLHFEVRNNNEPVDPLLFLPITKQ